MRIAGADSRIWPSDNAWGVPTLKRDLEPTELVAPVVRWGSVGRRTQHGGTWCFYVDDYRFDGSGWRSLAARVAASNPAAALEPNLSIFSWTPRAEALHQVYRKRWIARAMQGLGIPVWVDLCVPAEHHDLALLGVPSGWRAYATRGFEERADDIRGEYELAARHAAGEPMFLVWGGGPKVAAITRQLPGAMHLKAPRQECPKAVEAVEASPAQGSELRT